MNQSIGFVEHTLANGLKIVIEPMPHVSSAAAGFMVRTGARDETPELAGVSHFLEHMCFKGTPKRTWQQITVDFDNMGSTYNAYTSKERTVFFGWVRTEDLERQTELIADMMRSVIPQDEFEMEKKVVLEEIAMSDDQIDRQVYDLLHRHLYGDHPLSWPVLGTAESIESLTRDRLHAYFESCYHPGNMILVVAGAVDPNEVIDMAQRVCGDWVARERRPDRVAPVNAAPGIVVKQNDRFQQQALALTFPAPSAQDPDRETADVMAAILGGHNSRFFWNIIQAGIAPHVAAGRIDYCDVGIMVAFGFSEPDKSEQLLDAMRREIKTVVDEGVTEDEVQRVKTRTLTGLATEAEAPYYRLMQLFGDVDVLGRPRTVSERLAAIDAVTPDRIRTYLQSWPMGENGSLASLGPQDWPKTR